MFRFYGKELACENSRLSVRSLVVAGVNERRLYPQARKDCNPLLPLPNYKTCISKTHNPLQFEQENSPSIPTHTPRTEPLLSLFDSQQSHKNPTPSVDIRVEHLLGILTSEFRVFYFCFFLIFFIFHAFRVFSNFVFRLLVFRRSGVPVFRRSMF